MTGPTWETEVALYDGRSVGLVADAPDSALQL
jgi:hypothetical protein